MSYTSRDCTGRFESWERTSGGRASLNWMLSLEKTREDARPLAGEEMES